MSQINTPPSNRHGLATPGYVEPTDGSTGVLAKPSHSSSFLFERLPLELRLRILNFTHLGAQGDYCEEHHLIHIDNGPLFRKQGRAQTPHLDNREQHDPKDPRSRALPLSLLRVSRQTYQDAFEVLYRESHFVVAPTCKRALAAVHRLPKAGLQLIRRITLRASIGDAELIFRDAAFISLHAEVRYRASLWHQWAEFIRDYFEVEHLSVCIDLSIAGRWCLNDPPEKTLRTAYAYYRFVTSALCRIGAMKALAFDLAWAQSLRPWMEREVLGNRFKGDIGDPQPEPAGNVMGDGGSGVPYWHQNDERVPESNFINE